MPIFERQARSTMSTNSPDREPATWRTPLAIALALAIGAAIGVFLYASAVPFGPILFGWLVALLGAVVVTSILCILATSRYRLVGLAYAVGVASSCVIANLVDPQGTPDWWDLPLQFVLVFSILSVPALFTSFICALLKWEDDRAREKNS